MGFRRYVAPTAREALERIRKELGADAVILSNRRAGANRVEIIAAAQGQMDALVDDFVPAAVPAPAARKTAKVPAIAAAPAQARRAPPETFQEFIRRQSGEPGARTEGVAMYHQVARESDEPPMPLARLAATAPRMAPAPSHRPSGASAATRMPPKPAPERADPAVFRRRPSRLEESMDSPEAMPLAAQPPRTMAPPPAQLAPQPAPQPAPQAMQQQAPQSATLTMPQAAPRSAQLPESPPAPQPAILAIAQAAPQLAQAPESPPAYQQAPQPATVAIPQAVPQPAQQPAPPFAPQSAQQPVPQQAALQMPQAPLPPALVQPAPALLAAPQPGAVAPAETMFAQGPGVVAPLPDSRLMAELQSLRSALTDRISRIEVQLAKVEPATDPAPSATAAADVAAAPQTPVRRQVMTRLIMSGFSPQLSRRVGDAAPATLDVKSTDGWLQQVIGQYVRCPSDVDNPLLTPGAVALVGPTGVGKTTTIAKIAARFVVRHGAAALGLVTLDSYRMGAHEQLRGYGRILGVPVHTAHDAVSLRELLASLQGRRQVLVDTCGMSQRDPRLGEMLAMLDEVRFGERPVKRVLLINAASHAETLDEVARGWLVDSAHGAILTKIDEAARIGGALDALMRFQTPLLGLTNGQRVPEDWHPGNPPLLAHIALKPFGAAFSLDSDELQSLSRSGALIA